MSLRRAQTVVVGGGVMGVAIAWHLARRANPITEPVVLIEKSALAAGSSGRSGAILRQHYSDRELAVMARDSLRVYAGLEARTGRSIGFQRTGVITLAGPERPETIALVQRNVAMQRSVGITTHLVDAAEIRELVPDIVIADGAVGAYEPDGGGVDPVRTVEVFATLAREAGGITRLGVKVEAFVVEGDRVIGVDTAEGRVLARDVIVATGPWTKPLLAQIGCDLPLSVVRPEQHFLALPRVATSAASDARARLEDSVLDRFGLAHEVLPPSAHPVILDLERGFYTRCEGHAGRTRVGRMDYAHDDEVPDPDAIDERVSSAYVEWARRELTARLPVYTDEDDVGSQVGLYTLTPDAQALIGRPRQWRGLILVSGFSGHGFKLAPSVGEGVAQLVHGEPVTAFDEAFFAPDRFAGRAHAAPTGAFGL
ncbi:MAG: FAD-dependent oxidoreductase [Planctomycetes bacterium]|nr:FAD-dependent oxidoreductase [Planctomycetota bacterium]